MLKKWALPFAFLTGITGCNDGGGGNGASALPETNAIQAEATVDNGEAFLLANMEGKNSAESLSQGGESGSSSDDESTSVPAAYSPLEKRAVPRERGGCPGGGSYAFEETSTDTTYLLSITYSDCVIEALFLDGSLTQEISETGTATRFPEDYTMV